MRWIIEASLKFRFLLIFLAGALVYFGWGRLAEMPVDVFPEFAPPRVVIQVEAAGLSTEEVEGLITVPLEAALAGVPQLDVMRSKSVPGLSEIQMIFEPGTSVLDARTQVQERVAVARHTLPNVARPPIMLPPLSATSRTMKIGLSSKTMSLIELSELTRWKLRPRLMKVDGVANVATWGQRKRQLQVQVDPERLAQHHVTLDEVLEATSDALDVGLLSYRAGAKTGAGGFIDAADSRHQIIHVSAVLSPDELAKVAFRTKQGANLRLGDIATVVQGHQPMIGDGIINDGPGILLIVEKFPWANTIEVTEGVEAALSALKPGLPGVEIDSAIFRPATFIEMSIDNLTRALVIGAVFVVVVLFLFLYQWRVTVISLVAIPLSLIAAGLVFYFTGATMNTMVLAGFVIALGVVVDDAIIDIENIVRRLRERRSQGVDVSAARVIVDASVEVRNSITYATLIIVLAVSPVFFMEGLSGSFFRPLAFSFALALMASMVVALTVTPALSHMLLTGKALGTRQAPLVRWLQRVYGQILSRICAAPRLVFMLAGAATILGGAIIPLLGQTLLPEFKERDFLMHWVTKPGTSYPEMNRITMRASRELRAIPGVRNFGAHVGRAVAADEVVGINFTENWVSVDPKADYDTTLAAIQEVVDGYPGLYRDVQTYLKERVREVLTGASEAIVVRIYGPDLAVLRSKADELKRALQDIDGITDLHTELQEDIPHIAIEVDLERAKAYGVKPGDVRRAAATIMAGTEVSDVYRAANLYDVVVVGIPEAQHDLTNLRNLLIDTPGGGHVRLTDIAEVRIAPTPNLVKRENVSRRIDVAANVSGRDLGSVVADVERRLETIDFPQEYHPELVGEYAERRSAQGRLLGLSIVAALGILVLLQVSFGSWRLAGLAYTALPMALVGGVVATWFAGGVISLGSLVGFLTVLGIAARNGIMLINHFQHLEMFEGEVFGRTLVLRGARERLSPILMTALTAGLALLPLVAYGDIPGHEIEHPMAVVILGGLVSSTFLNLFVVPPLYLYFAKSAALPSLRSPGPISRMS